MLNAGTGAPQEETRLTRLTRETESVLSAYAKANCETNQ